MEKIQIMQLHRNFLEDFGFTIDNSILHYVKENVYGKQIVFFHLTQQKDVTVLEYNLGIRIDKVEYIVHKFLPSLGDYKEKSVTLVETMDAIEESFPRRFVIHDEKEIPTYIETVEKFLIKEGFHWLDSLLEGNALEEYFNANLDRPIVTQNFTYRSARGIVLAKLFNPERYHQIKDDYLRALDEIQVTPFTLACFLNLIAYLDEEHQE
ncbi:hypothetical protein [Mongoliitalea daihaiensis]|uniref:hypothetical protein n=1 Tax=Mongoliitalea daihaiensis TaxID=2782006 RepID=UPI001F2B50AE|nr:hypothetical protein [Mongoliitalea daihaiensis]UJP64095.1 hypothetical protein IPZ59_14915 [Mongoliitalea daihaiensis]